MRGPVSLQQAQRQRWPPSVSKLAGPPCVQQGEPFSGGACASFCVTHGGTGLVLLDFIVNTCSAV